VKLLVAIINCPIVACNANNTALAPIKPIFIIDDMQELSASINKPFIGFPTPRNYSICHGQQAGTSIDRAENCTNKGLNGQLDCIDEAINMTVYLHMLSEANLMVFHQQASRTYRGGLLSPHNTATIIDITSHSRYAVDGWFDNNGEPPAIIPLTLWKSDWKPKAHQ